MRQTKAFCKFLPVIVVLYLGMYLSEHRAQRPGADPVQGFLTTFVSLQKPAPDKQRPARSSISSLRCCRNALADDQQSMLARDKISVNEMSWILIKVFFGSSYLGFDVAVTVS